MTFERGVTGPRLRDRVALTGLGLLGETPAAGTTPNDGSRLVGNGADASGGMAVRVNSYDPTGSPRSASFLPALQCRDG